MDKDFNKLYDHRETPLGIEEYKNAKTGKLTKTCAKCRSCVLKSQAKKPQYKPIPLKTKINILTQVLNSLDPDVLEQLHLQEPRLKNINSLK